MKTAATFTPSWFLAVRPDYQPILSIITFGLVLLLVPLAVGVTYMLMIDQKRRQDEAADEEDGEADYLD